MDATTVAVDLAKDVFQVATANRAGRIIERRRLTRGQFERFVDALPAGVEVVKEACGTAHDWGRRCHARGDAGTLSARGVVRGLAARVGADSVQRPVSRKVAAKRCSAGRRTGSFTMSARA
jgi:transposase